MELILTNITKKYGNYEAISNQSFILKNGVYGLLGVNGAGKTTLMNMICTLSRPSGGSIMFNGKGMGSYKSKITGNNRVTPLVWCPCKGNCTGGCQGSCKALCSGGCSLSCHGRNK